MLLRRLSGGGSAARDLRFENFLDPVDDVGAVATGCVLELDDDRGFLGDLGGELGLAQASAGTSLRHGLGTDLRVGLDLLAAWLRLKFVTLHSEIVVSDHRGMMNDLMLKGRCTTSVRVPRLKLLNRARHKVASRFLASKRGLGLIVLEHRAWLMLLLFLDFGPALRVRPAVFIAGRLPSALLLGLSLSRFLLFVNQVPKRVLMRLFSVLLSLSGQRSCLRLLLVNLLLSFL